MSLRDFYDKIYILHKYRLLEQALVITFTFAWYVKEMSESKV